MSNKTALVKIANEAMSRKTTLSKMDNEAMSVSWNLEILDTYIKCLQQSSEDEYDIEDIAGAINTLWFIIQFKELEECTKANSFKVLIELLKPRIQYKSKEWLRSRGYNIEDIFRIDRNIERFKKICEQFE